MPSSSAKQARFMAGIAHGWHPSDVKAPPLKVAKEFNRADKGTGVRGKRRRATAGDQADALEGK